MKNVKIAKGANLSGMVGYNKEITFNVGSTKGMKSTKTSQSGKTTYVVVENVRDAFTGALLLDHAWLDLALVGGVSMIGKNDVTAKSVVSSYDSKHGKKFGFDLV